MFDEYEPSEEIITKINNAASHYLLHCNTMSYVNDKEAICNEICKQVGLSEDNITNQDLLKAVSIFEKYAEKYFAKVIVNAIFN